MSNPLNNESQLQPIVRRAIVSLYGRTARNITIHEAEKIPLFKKPKKYWQVDVLFSKENQDIGVQLEVDIANGLITKVHETHRDPGQS